MDLGWHHTPVFGQQNHSSSDYCIRVSSTKMYPQGSEESCCSGFVMVKQVVSNQESWHQCGGFFSWLSHSGPWPFSVLFVWCSCSSSLLEQAPLVHMLEPIEELSEEEKGNDWFSSKYAGMCFLKTKNVIWYLQYFSLYFIIFVWFGWEHCVSLLFAIACKYYGFLIQVQCFFLKSS